MVKLNRVECGDHKRLPRLIRWLSDSSGLLRVVFLLLSRGEPVLVAVVYVVAHILSSPPAPPLVRDQGLHVFFFFSVFTTPDRNHPTHRERSLAPHLFMLIVEIDP